jgi:anti-anti-sigma factor
MNIKTESYGHAVAFLCKGEINVDTLEMFLKEVHRQINEEVTDVIFDFGEVTFVDSAGWEALLDIQDSLAERLGQVTLTNLDENLAKILEMCRLEGTFPTCSDVAEAVRAI